MFCSNCGSKINSADNFCGSCGNRILAQATAETATNQAETNKDKLHEFGSDVTASSITEERGCYKKGTENLTEVKSDQYEFLFKFLKPIAYAAYSFLIACTLLVSFEEVTTPFPEDSSIQYVFVLLFTFLLATITNFKCKNFKNTTKYFLYVFLFLFGSTVIYMLATNNPDSNTSDQADSVSEEQPSFNSEKSKGLTSQQKNARRQAMMYAANNVLSFSRSGLIQQLTSPLEGYEVTDATIAVDSIEIDYNDQAAKSARGYVNAGIHNFSCDGLIQQLINGDGFTKDQAKFGAKTSGACQ